MHHVFKFNISERFLTHYNLNGCNSGYKFKFSFFQHFSKYKLKKGKKNNKNDGIINENYFFGVWFIQSTNSNASTNVRYVYFERHKNVVYAAETRRQKKKKNKVLVNEKYPQSHCSAHSKP